MQQAGQRSDQDSNFNQGTSEGDSSGSRSLGLLGSQQKYISIRSEKLTYQPRSDRIIR